MESLHTLWEQYQGRVAFVVVYIREAHPEDGWVVTPNRDEGIRTHDPVTNEERETVAATCALNLKIRMPVVVDAVDDEIARAYGALPDRLYLVGKGGNVVYQGAPGPWGFRTGELGDALASEVD